MSTRRQYIQLYHGWAIRTQGALTLLRIFMKVKYMNRTIESGTTDIASRNCSFYTGFNSVSSQLMAQEESTQLKCTDRRQMDMRMLSRFRRIRPFATPWAAGTNAGVGCHAFLQGNLPDPGIKPTSPTPPALQEDRDLLSHRRSLMG